MLSILVAVLRYRLPCVKFSYVIHFLSLIMFVFSIVLMFVSRVMYSKLVLLFRLSCSCQCYLVSTTLFVPCVVLIRVIFTLC